MGGEVRDRYYGEGEKVRVDGTHFVNCTFRRAVLEYGGGPHPNFEDCTLDDIGWHFSAGALRTIQLLQMIGSATAGAAFLTDLFKPGHFIGD